MRLDLVTLALLTAVPITDALGQEALAVGERVRLHANCSLRREVVCQRHAGRVATLEADTLRLALEDGRTAGIPLAAISHLEVQRGRKSRWQSGAQIGSAAGLLVGVILAAATRPENDAYGLHAMAVSGYSMLGGALIGGIIGSTGETDRWVRVAPSRLAPGPQAPRPVVLGRLRF